MEIRWKTLFFKLSLWLALEILFNLVGFDDFADYAEFILEDNYSCTEIRI